MDSTFGDSGLSIIGTEVARVRDIQVLADGKILVGAASANGPAYRTVLTQLMPNGSLDGSFGAGGITDVLIGVNDSFGGMDVDALGRILITAGIDEDTNLEDSIQSYAIGVARFLPNGSLDQSFGTGGTKTIEFGYGDEFGHDILVQDDGKIVVFGEKSYQTGDFFHHGSELLLVRLTDTTLTIDNSSVEINEGTTLLIAVVLVGLVVCRRALGILRQTMTEAGSGSLSL